MEKETAIEILERLKDANQTTSSVLFWWEDLPTAIDKAVAVINELEKENEELFEKIDKLEDKIDELNNRIHELEMSQIITFKRKEKRK